MLIESPPQLNGNEQQQLRTMYSYLYQMAEQLNNALNNITEDNFAPTASQALKAVTTGEAQKQNAKQADTLKALIIKTADIVHAEMDELEAVLKSDYVAHSDFGAYQESITSAIKANALGVVQSYDYSSVLQPVNDKMVDFENHRLESESYIRTGILYYDNNGLPVTGVAVGENLAKVIVDGKETISRAGLMSTFTAGRLSFWQNGVEVAYMTKEKLYIAHAELTDDLVVGNYVIKRFPGGGFGIMVNRTEA